MAKHRCECLCSFNHADRLKVCTGHGYRWMIVHPVADGNAQPELCPKCRAVLNGAALAPIVTRASV